MTPFVVLTIPRPSDAVRLARESLVERVDVSHTIAVSSSETESDDYVKLWGIDARRGLLIVRETPQRQVEALVEAVVHLASSRQSRPIAILILDSPDIKGYFNLKRNLWNERLASELQNRIDDIQVLEYSDSWRTSPPRIR